MSLTMFAAALVLGQAEPIKWDLSKVFSTSENLSTNRMWAGYTIGLGGEFHPNSTQYTNDPDDFNFMPEYGAGYLRGWRGRARNSFTAILKNTDAAIVEKFEAIPVPPGHFVFLCTEGLNSRRIFPCLRFRPGVAGRQRIVGSYTAGSRNPMDFRIFLRRNGVLSFILSKSVAVGAPLEFDIRTAPLDPFTDVLEFQSGVGVATFTANVFGPVP